MRRRKGDALRRLVIAFCVAPVLPVVVKTWLLGQPGEGISFVLLMIIGGAAYGMQPVAGVPLYLLLRRYRQNDLVAYLLAGFFTVMIVMTVLTVCLSGFNISLILRSAGDSASLALWGVPIGAIFWLIARPDWHPAPLVGAPARSASRPINSPRAKAR